ncbi:MAG: substrate-binding domain-containing protein [Candidatus Thiodiazotropha sp. (ex Dulcina madagascariensis)]|nr:substrate-binding domain-containing protein [Candidatus Thiodiazotropha sp. (ex Dulcina madagascariensis)]
MHIFKRQIKQLAAILLSFSSLTATAGEQLHIAFAQDTLGNDWRLAQIRQVEQELAKHSGVRFSVTDGLGDTALQIQHIEDLALSGIDLLMTSPRTRAALTPAIQKVYRQGIPVVLVSRGINSRDYTAFIHPDDRRIAEAATRYLIRQIHGKGHILMLEGIPGSSTSDLRTAGFLNIVQEHPEISYTRRVANYLRADAILAMEDLLSSGTHIDAIFAQSDSMAEAARMVLSKHGIDPKSIPSVGIDYIRSAREAIRRGEQSASFTYPTGGAEGARMALKILKGEAVPKEIVLESTMVTKDNVDQVEPIF